MNPQGWRWVRTGAFLRSRERFGGTSDALLSLSVKHGVVPREPDAGRAASEDVSGYRLVQPGDLVVNRLVARDGALAVSGLTGSVSPAYWVLESDPDLALPEFLGYALRSQAVLAEIRKRSKNMPPAQYDLPWQQFKTMPILLPPIPQQRAIAAFLAREVTKVDALVLEQEKLVEVLRERRAALITHRVGGAWPTVPFVRCMVSQVDYRGATPTKVADGVQLVTARNVRNGWIDYEVSREYIDPADYDAVMRRGVPQLDDLLFTMEAPLGNVALVDRTDIALAQRVIKWRANRELALPRFLMYAVMSEHFQYQLRVRATGSTALGIKASRLPELRIRLPILAEQARVAGELDSELAQIDSLITEAGGIVEVAKERRSALITAAVTGQIDVRGEG